MKLGITGGPGEGKSTVLRVLAEQGLATASADDFARAAFQEPDIQRQLADAVGGPVPVSREQVREAVFRDPAQRRAVNRVMHPRILELMRASSAVAVEAPLLVETCLMSEFDRIWVVACGPDEQLRRLAARLGSIASARQMIASQLPTRVKSAFADRIIRTNLPEDSVRSFVIEAIERDLADHVA